MRRASQPWKKGQTGLVPYGATPDQYERPFYFISTTFEDLEFTTMRKPIAKNGFSRHVLRQIESPAQSLKFGFELTLQSRDAGLLSYCKFARLHFFIG